MAEILLSTFLPVLFEKLGSAAFKKLAHFKEIQTELKKWETSLSEIQALLNDASQKEITDEHVKGWLSRLQHLAYDIDDILDDLATEAELTDESGAIISKVRNLIPTCCTSFSVSNRMHEHDKLNNITTKLHDLEKETVTLGLIVKDGRSKNINRRYETSLVDASTIFGRQGDEEVLLHKLLGDEPCNQNFSIVPIVGMGGVGKTTLARLLYDGPQVKVHFELRAWVCVSGEFDIFNISKDIFRSLASEDKEFNDLYRLQVALREKLSKKRFLLVLDDVWSESYEDWEILASPFLAGAPGSKIIMTTRKLSLLTQLRYVHPYHLNTLSHDDALSLFSQIALGVNNFDSHLTLKPHGEGIVKKCNGLPLALIALGRLLRTKTEEEEWKELLNSEIWRLQTGDDIVPALRLSYRDLPASLKQLFAYCSLFPKDYVFDKEELILLWMAEGFLHQSTARKSMERLGHEYFEELLSRSFFQHAPNEESLFVMHDLMNDLATSVAGDFFLRLDNEMEKDVRKEALEKYRHMSFVREGYGTYKKFKAFERAKSLRTFLALSVGVKESWRRFYLSNKILVDLLPELPLLRVLCLSDFEINEVPESIGSLKHLRYLNLSRTRITHLPENVCNLYNLQTLIVFGCDRLTTLPNSFLKLKNLRHFDTRDTRLLNKMPSGIGELKSLQTLTKIIIGGDKDFAITELKGLENLHGKISIKGLDKVQNAMHARKANLSQKRLSELEVEWRLSLFDGSGKETLEKEVLNELKPHNDNLRKLKIVSYGGMEFPNWVGDPSFHRLAHVSIHGSKKCTSLPPLGQLPSLKELFIGGMDGVKAVGLELLGTGHAFPSLEILNVENMHGWEVWSTNRRVVFPCLQELCINHCPNLVEVSLEALPSLRVLKMNGCGHGVLRSLVHVAPSVTKLEIYYISGLTDQQWGGVIECLGAVEEVIIWGCNEIRYLWESEAEVSKVLVNLRQLVVLNCDNLVSLGEKEEDNCGSNLTSLKMLHVVSCKSMERCSCPNSIETLLICACSSITSVSFPAGGQKLKSLEINCCKKLLEKELGGGENNGVLINTSMRMLEVIHISRWPNLKSISELNYFIHLTHLIIIDCPSMESFPDGELPNLTSLKHLEIVNCPSMDASFPRGLWPPKLCSLEIGRLKKPISEWGLQNFPTSLVKLILQGGSSEDVSSCSRLSDLLPSSLTSLDINEFEKLESLSMGLQHLTSLQELSIGECPNMIYLPEMPSLQHLNISKCPRMTNLPEMPSLQHLFISKCPKMINPPEMLFRSLLSLRIHECPNLKESYGRKGSHWCLISHIPCIEIDYELQS